jgi:hypothetical protein
VLYDGGPSKGAGVIEETVTVQIPRIEAEELIHIIGNYIEHYTEDDYYNGEPEIPALMGRLITATYGK